MAPVQHTSSMVYHLCVMSLSPKSSIMNHRPFSSVAFITQSTGLLRSPRPRPHLRAIGGHVTHCPHPLPLATAMSCVLPTLISPRLQAFELSATAGDQHPIVAPTPRPNHLGIHDQCLAHGRHVSRFPGLLSLSSVVPIRVLCTP